MIVRRTSAWVATAVVLELDGVLLDDAAADRAAWRWWATRAGLDPDVTADLAWGRRASDVVAELAPGVPGDLGAAAVEERRRVLLRSVQRRRGTSAFLRGLPPRRWAVASAAGADLTARQLRRARVTPPVLITADDVQAGPPLPATVEAAADALAARAGDVVAVVGTPAGAAAAHEAGTTVVVVGDPGADLEADGRVDDLAGLRVRLVTGGFEVSLGPPTPRVR